MKHGLLISALAVFLLLPVTAALSADQSSKPEFLADKHLKLGLTCEKCHGQGQPKEVLLDQCLSCHGSYPDLAKRTARLELNPHESPHYPNLECATCHHGHQESEDFCASCHNQR